MEKKVCKQCGLEKPYSDFYKRENNKTDCVCKDCRKENVRKRYFEKIQDPAYVEKERKRGREKYARLGYSSKKSNACKEKEKTYTSLRNARRDFNISLSSDIELHHWNYNLTDSIIALDRRLHHRLHTSISLNIDEGIYYYGSEKLDTIEKHMNVVKQICDLNGFDFSAINILTK